MITTQVRYDDLLGLRYELGANVREDNATDCIGVGREVFLRAGWDATPIPTSDQAYQVAISCTADGDAPSEWVSVQDATDGGSVALRLRFGDIVICRSGTMVHSSIVVNEAHQVALSAAEGHGVYGCAVSALSRVVAVYRLRGARE